VALGATAARSLMGKTVTISKLRGQMLPFENGSKLMVTIPPSSVLRIRDSEDKKRQYAGLVDDLRQCAQLLRAA